MNVFDRYAPFIQDFIYQNSWESLRAVQVAAGDAVFNTDCNVLLCASTASGKTEAAFFPILTLFTEDMPSSVGAIYIGPLKALINDQFMRLNDLCREADIPVWHWHGDVSQSHKNKLLKNPSGILQITPESLEALLLHKHSYVARLFGDLRFIVIDEVQTVPCKMLSLFNLAVNFLSQVCRATVLLCSATQPCLEQTRHPLTRQPADIVPYDKKLRDVFKRTDIIFDGSRTLDELAARLDNLLSVSDSLLIVCNLKKQAEFLFRYMKSNHGDCLVFHLSAGMCIAHRRAAIEKLRQALAACGDKKVICVSTQVIEAGVDISFGCVVRLAAGLDSVIQSAGRCNRNGELDSPAPVYLISCADENLAGLGDIKAQKDALNQLLTEYSLNSQAFDSDLASDNSVGRYYRALYAAMPDRAQDYPTKHGFTVYDLLADNDAFSGRCGENDLFAMRQAFKTAGSEFNVFDSNGVDVIVPYGGGAELISDLMSPRTEHDITYLHSLCERAKPYTVSVYSHQQRMLEEAGGIYPAAGGAVRVLSAANYDSDVGVILEPDINSFIV